MARPQSAGGLGPSWTSEGFTSDYELPNETAYAEACAAVGPVFWAHQMLLTTGDAQYADVMERALYNGAVSGISLVQPLLLREPAYPPRRRGTLGLASLPV